MDTLCTDSTPSNSHPVSVAAGSEDALGDMDFKVAGGQDAITAFQMDIKVSLWGCATDFKAVVIPSFLGVAAPAVQTTPKPCGGEQRSFGPSCRWPHGQGLWASIGHAESVSCSMLAGWKLEAGWAH